jgi:hypothetical protein
MNAELAKLELAAAVLRLHELVAQLPPDVQTRRPDVRGMVRIRCLRTELLALLGNAKLS